MLKKQEKHTRCARMIGHAEGARGWARQPHLEEHAATEGTLLQEERSNILSDRNPEERELTEKSSTVNHSGPPIIINCFGHQR